MCARPLHMSAGAWGWAPRKTSPIYNMGVVVVDVTVIAQLISQVGFPIACCVIMFMALSKEQDSHKSEMSAIVEAVNNNTIALTKLSERIGNNDH